MIVATSASTAALNGRNSTSRSRSGGCSTSGSSWCEAASLLIDRDPERQIRNEPRRFERELGDLPGIGDVACEEDDAAEAELLRERTELRGNLMSVEAGEEQLTDLPAQRGGRHASIV